jgi:RNA 2',3'-cyclic 3'-phosphodiesterase
LSERLKSPRLRLFVALDLPEALTEELSAWRAQAFGERAYVRLPANSSLHVTLVFLGYQAERDVGRIAEASFADRPSSFDLRALEVVEVPRRRPRLYAVSLDDPGDALARWQAGLSERLRELGVYEPEKRPFWPHVTVARVKAPRRRDRQKGSRRDAPAEPALGPAPQLPEPLKRPFRAEHLTLYKSTLRPQGALYEPLAELLTSK